MRVLSLPVLLLMASSAPAMAQVGHPPDQTPYRDLVPGHTFTPMAGYVGGSGGPLKLGPHAGMVYGARYDFRSNRNLGFALSVATGKLDRLIVNPFVKLANRTSGPVQQRTTFVDLTAQFNVSGGKSWHGLAPYIGLSGGIALSDREPSDTSGYKFGNKFYVAPQLGVRYFVTSHLNLRADIRGVFWKLTYPNSFTQEPVEEPGTADSPNAVRPTGDLSDWTLTPWFQVGLGYVFHW